MENFKKLTLLFSLGAMAAITQPMGYVAFGITNMTKEVLAKTLANSLGKKLSLQSACAAQSYACDHGVTCRVKPFGLNTSFTAVFLAIKDRMDKQTEARGEEMRALSLQHDRLNKCFLKRGQRSLVFERDGKKYDLRGCGIGLPIIDRDHAWTLELK